MNAEKIEEAYSKGYDGLTKVVCKAEPTMKIGDRVFPVIHEEWHIADYDGAISSMNLGENPSISKLVAMMKNIERDDDEEELYIAAYKIYHDNYNVGEHSVAEMCEKAREIAEDLYHVGDLSLKDHFMEEAYMLGDIKDGDIWESYIDWEHYAQNQMYNYQKVEVNDATYLYQR